MGIKKGFTLIEVCLVMMIFGIAVTSMMALFPVGLRQGNMAVSDSVLTMFGDYVLNAVTSVATEMDWSDWQSADKFSKAVERGGVRVGGKPLKVTGPGAEDEEVIKDYLDMKVTIKYKLSIVRVAAPEGPASGTPSSNKRPLYRITLRVTDNKNGKVADGAVFTTTVVYLGEDSLL